MIELIGASGTAEYSAAQQIRDVLLDMWPDIGKSRRELDDVRIRANAHLSGYKVEEIDVVICIRFSKPRSFVPTGLLKTRSGQRVVSGKKILIDNLMLAIEVKDHSGKAVKVEGESVFVHYSRSDEWKDATEQNRNQLFALRELSRDIIGYTSFVHRCLVMRGLPDTDCSGVLPAEFSANHFFTQVAKCSQIVQSQGRYFLSSLEKKSDMDRFLSSFLFRKIQASTLDRKKMDRISGDAAGAISSLDSLGNELIKLRGRGGTGKTIIMLQTAVQQYRSFGHRTLILTYNVALVSDIKRTLYLMGVGSSLEHGGVLVKTVMSFLYTVFSEVGVTDSDADTFEASYLQGCKEFKKLLDNGALTKKDIGDLFLSRSDDFVFDFVMIDEAQDCPQEEVEVLAQLFEQKRLVIADGVDQMLRTTRSSWGGRGALPKTIALKKCLRMKSNLALFANSVANAVGVDWQVEMNSAAPGGRVLILEGGCKAHSGKLLDLLADAKEEGNEAIDFLYCVPEIQSKEQPGDLIKTMQDLDFSVWNGTDSKERKTVPFATDSHRLVTYESCRGLEGWTVVLEHFDRYLERSLSLSSPKTGRNTEGHLGLMDPKDYAWQKAWERSMIALTRPMDTLVISLADVSKENPVNQLLMAVAKEHPDFVEWH